MPLIYHFKVITTSHEGLLKIPPWGDLSMPLIYHFMVITAPHEGSWATAHAKKYKQNAVYNEMSYIHNAMHQISTIQMQ